LLTGNLGAAKIFSTAFETIKFLSETRPIIGFSSRFGTATFLAASLAYLFAIYKIILLEIFQKNK
jgi:hypothetical protein